jgi:hypothetical protein
MVAGPAFSRPLPPPSGRQPDDLRKAYLTMVALGTASALLLGLGLVNLLTSSAPWARTGLQASVAGIYAYDPATGSVSTKARSHYSRQEQFAARPNWGQLPPSLLVGAAWYTPDQVQVGSAGPDRASRLAAHRALVPMTLVDGPAGMYTLFILHYVNRQPVEILDRQAVKVVGP